MKLEEERAPDGCSNIDEVITRAEIDAATVEYRRTAGFAVASLASGVSVLDADGIDADGRDAGVTDTIDTVQA